MWGYHAVPWSWGQLTWMHFSPPANVWLSELQNLLQQQEAWVLDKWISLKNSVNRITFPRPQLVVKFRSRFLTFDVCLSQTFPIKVASHYNQDLNLPRVWGCSDMPVNKSVFCLKPKSFLGYILCHDIWQEKEKKPKYLYIDVYASSGGRKYWTKYISHCEGTHFCRKLNVFIWPMCLLWQ